jgi:hypothetical protein
MRALMFILLTTAGCGTGPWCLGAAGDCQCGLDNGTEDGHCGPGADGFCCAADAWPSGIDSRYQKGSAGCKCLAQTWNCYDKGAGSCSCYSNDTSLDPPVGACGPPPGGICCAAPNIGNCRCISATSCPAGSDPVADCSFSCATVAGTAFSKPVDSCR